MTKILKQTTTETHEQSFILGINILVFVYPWPDG